MGCVNSRTDINDRHPNIFQVINVNEQGNAISPGKLQVTEMELVLYQRGKEPTKWPLRALRKYGFDMDVFSFECGRRCPTGEGIYAFRCRRAEQLFNIVQQYITFNVNEENAAPNLPTMNTIEFPVPVVSTGPPVQRRLASQTDTILRSHPVLSRPGSMTSNDPTSPTSTTARTSSPPATAETLEHNNNKRGSLVEYPTYTNTSPATLEGASNPAYVNMETVNDGQAGHIYMNVHTGKESSLPPSYTNETGPCYMNIQRTDVESLVPVITNNNEDYVGSVPQTPTVSEELNASSMSELNYAELHLDAGKETPPQPASQVVQTESPNRESKNYVSIDFEKTNALSQSRQPRMETEEEGSRKTRHNSTIHYNNSLSD